MTFVHLYVTLLILCKFCVQFVIFNNIFHFIKIMMYIFSFIFFTHTINFFVLHVFFNFLNLSVVS